MSTTTRSARRLILTAHHVGRMTLPNYTHPNSRKDFTLPQLFACLAIKAFYRLDFRSAEQMLREWPGLCEAIGLSRAPDHATLHRAAQHLGFSDDNDRLLLATIKLMLKRRRVKLGAVDSSGFESRHVSAYFARRRKHGKNKEKLVVYHRFPKLGIVVDCATHLILGRIAERGPKPDVDRFLDTLDDALEKVFIERVAADAGYDSESNHRDARELRGVKTIIPPNAGRRTDKPPTGRYRRQMHDRFDSKTYGQRWQVETVFSMLKRNLGCELTARKSHTQTWELRLMCVFHNLMILRHKGT